MFFEPGETSVTVDVPIQDDAILEDTESFSATLMSQLPNVLVFENASNADIAILDNDRKGGHPIIGPSEHFLLSIGVTIGFVETLYSVDENDGSIVVTVAVLSGELSEDVVVGFNTQDDTATGLLTFRSLCRFMHTPFPATDDYETISSLLTFGPGVTTRAVSIPITNDNVHEPDPEQFLANLGLLTTGVEVTIAPDQATVVINDDDGKVPIYT